MTLDEVATAALPQSLAVMGAFHTAAEDDPGDGTLILLGPREPGFWPNFQASPEARDGDRNPMDRWSYPCSVELSSTKKGHAADDPGASLGPRPVVSRHDGDQCREALPRSADVLGDPQGLGLRVLVVEGLAEIHGGKGEQRVPVDSRSLTPRASGGVRTTRRPRGRR